MAQVLVRDLPDGVVERLRALARAQGRSLESELRAILVRAADLSHAELRRIADELVVETASGEASDSVELLHEDRAR